MTFFALFPAEAAWEDIADDKIMRTHSRGGVAAYSSGMEDLLISFATSLDLYFGCASPWLLTSTHRTHIGYFVVTPRRSWM